MATGIKPLAPEDVKYIAIHCSATNAGQDVGVTEIDRWHRNRGFIKIGYHFVIRRNGTLEIGRPITERGAHVEDFNHCSIGICMVGGVDMSKRMLPENNFTKFQFDTLKTLVLDLKSKFPQAIVQGHRDFPEVAKACPSFSVADWLETAGIS